MPANHPADQRLSRFDTCWTVLGRGRGDSEEAILAKRQLLERYIAAVRRYLLGAMRDAEAADELTQEFAVRFMKGDLHRADPTRGRFRDFVKGVLFHLIADHYRRLKRTPTALPDGSLADDGHAADPAADDRQFTADWREELLCRAWVALEKHERETGQLYYTVLLQRAKRPDVRSAEMAEQLSAELGRPLRADAVRQTLHRSREKFAGLLLDEILQTLREPTLETLEAELIDIGLLEYCRPALEALRASD